MSAGRLVLLRHGRTAYNASARMQGQIDIPLDDVGLWQAETSAARLVQLRTPTRIIASDLVRAHETALAVGRVTGLDVVTDPRLRERSFGVWEGLTRDEILAGWSAEFESWASGGQPEGVGVETREAVADRCADAIAHHAAGLSHDETLLVVSHGSAITSMVGALVGLPAGARTFAGLSNAHWAELVPARGDGTSGWRVTGYNVGPADVSSDWNAGPDEPVREDPDTDTRNPD